MTDQNLTPEAVERVASAMESQLRRIAGISGIKSLEANLLRALAQQTAALQAEVERLTEELEHMTACKDIHQTKRHEYFMRAEKAEAERDVAKKLLRSCIKGNNALREAAQERKSERDEARAQVVGAFEAAASVAWADRESGLTVNTKIRALTPDDAQAALQSMLADAERDMRQRAADSCLGLMTAQSARKFILALPLKHADREEGK